MIVKAPPGPIALRVTDRAVAPAMAAITLASVALGTGLELMETAPNPLLGSATGPVRTLTLATLATAGLTLLLARWSGRPLMSALRYLGALLVLGFGVQALLDDSVDASIYQPLGSLLVGLALLTDGLVPSGWGRGTARSLAAAAAFLGLFSFAGYVGDVRALHHWPSEASPLSPLWSFAMVALGVGIIWLRTEYGLIALVRQQEPEAIQARWLFPTIAAVPLIATALVLTVAPRLGGAVSAAAVAWSAFVSAGLMGMATLAVNIRLRSASARLREQEVNLRATVNGIGVGIVHERVADGVCTFANGEFGSLVGVPAEGRALLDFVHPDDRARDAEAREKVILGSVEKASAELRVGTESGGWRWTDCRLSAQRNLSGEAYQLFRAYADVSERKALEEKLAFSDRALAAAGSAVAIASGGPDLRILYVNEAFTALTGYEESEAIGANPSVLEAPGTSRRELDRLMSAFDSGDVVVATMQHRRKDGSLFWNRVSASVLEIASLDKRYLILVMDDVSDEVQREQSLEEAAVTSSLERGVAEAAVARQNDVINYISHELRSPLNSALMWCGVLEADDSPDTVAKAVDNIQSSIRTQARLIQDMVDAVRSNDEVLSVEMRKGNLVDIVAAAAAELEPEISEKELTLELSLPSRAVPVAVDSVRFQQALRNVLSNALKYSAPKTKIAVGLTAPNSEAIVTVSDEGLGIDEEELAHLFDPYFRGPAASRRTKGLGLGLTVVKAIMDMHGGKVAVASEGKGRGTIVTLALPLAEAGGESKL